MRHSSTQRSRSSLIVTVAIALAVAIGFAVSQAQNVRPAGGYAVVHDGDGGVQSFALDGSDGTEFTIATSYGANTIRIEGGAVRVSDADCPNRDCVEQGAIDSVGQRIVCLPHKLWIEISESADVSESSDPSAPSASDGYDTVTR